MEIANFYSICFLSRDIWPLLVVIIVSRDCDNFFANGFSYFKSSHQLMNFIFHSSLFRDLKLFSNSSLATSSNNEQLLSDESLVVSSQTKLVISQIL